MISRNGVFYQRFLKRFIKMAPYQGFLKNGVTSIIYQNGVLKMIFKMASYQ